jgi:Flp pilus assembly protein TadD
VITSARLSTGFTSGDRVITSARLSTGFRSGDRKKNLKRQSFLVFLLLTNLCALAVAQASTHTSDQEKRQKAVALFNQGKRLEALPLLEELVPNNQDDAELLVDLAASLVDHAATLSDQEAAGKERLRAKEILNRVWGMGNPSPLAENLRQLLSDMPASGAIKFSENPAVEQVMLAGEAAFSRRDFDEALKDYGKALELEPSNYGAVLFTANTYDRENDFAKAAEWYQRAMQLDPNVETAYRYYADMLAKQGDMAKARSMLIQAAVAEPYNKIVWREIRAWATINNTAFTIVYAPIPVPKKDDTAPISSAWRAYHSTRAGWEKGSKFQQRFPQEAGYRHSLPEESEALSATVNVLEKLKQDKKTAETVAKDPVAGLLMKLQQAGALEPYVLFSLGDDGIAKDYKAYRAKNRAKLEDYLDKFVMPPAPGK